MALQVMQLVLAGVSLAMAMATSAVTAHQSAVLQPAQNDMGSMSEISLEDFMKQKQVAKRKAYLDQWRKEISRPQTNRKHKVSLNAFSSSMHARAPPPVQYVPKIGVGNVTTPTELPPPPPTLNPATDMQPMDTAIGNYIASSFLAGPTQTPPPTQEALNLAYGCPVLLQYPETLQVSVPSGCESSRYGNWSHPQGEPVMKWQEVCDLRTAVLPIVTYSTPDNQAFASSRTRFSFFGNTMEVLDCGLNIQYTIEEKIYHQTKFTDPEMCKKYKSCDGTVFLQYFMKDRTGTVVAETPYLNLFQNNVVVQQPGSGLPIATLERVGAWTPWEVCPEWEKLWSIKSAQAPPPPFDNAENRWPIAVMMTMLLLRDPDRRASGVVLPSTCEIVNVSVLAGLILLFLVAVILLTYVFYRFCFARCKLFFYNVEVTFFPHTMYKPSRYEG